MGAAQQIDIWPVFEDPHVGGQTRSFVWPIQDRKPENLIFPRSSGHSLIFFSLFFWKIARKTTKKQGFFIVAEPLKSLGKKGKTRKKARNSLGRKKARKSKKARKRRLGFLHCVIECHLHTHLIGKDQKGLHKRGIHDQGDF